MANKQAPLAKKTGPVSDIDDISEFNAFGGTDHEHNQTGHQHATQKNEGRRTPESRSDREAKVGGNNQSQSRRGGTPGNSGGR